MTGKFRVPRDEDLPALVRLIDRDRLPGQPPLTESALREALAGRSPIDAGWWDELADLEVRVLTDPDGRSPVGAVSWAYRPRDATAVLLWLHADEDAVRVAALLHHALAHHPAVRWTAFEFSTALGLGVEGLPVRHRPATAAGLAACRFGGTDLWLAMRRPLHPLPPHPELDLRVSPARLDGNRLHTADDRGSVEVSGVRGGSALIAWLEVEPDARGRGLGEALLVAALHHLAARGAREVVLFVDDDEPGGPRDRAAAVRLYRRTAFEDVDRLHSFSRAPGRP